MPHVFAPVLDRILLSLATFLASALCSCNGENGSKPAAPPRIVPARSIDSRLRLRDAIHDQIGSPESPWAIAHALLAFGPDLTVDEDEKAIVVLMRSHLRHRPSRFLVQGDAGALGEVHPHLVLKTLVELGMEEKLCVDLAEAAVASFRVPTTYEEWNDAAWLIEALARMTHKADSRIHAITLADLAEGALSELEAADVLVDKLIEKNGIENFERPRATGGPEQAAVWAYTCGGQHLLQAVLVAFRENVLPPETRPRVAARLKTFLRRIDAETAFRRRQKRDALASGSSALTVEYQSALPLLKLYGHALETLHRARGSGLLAESILRSNADGLARKLQQLCDGLWSRADMGAVITRVKERDRAEWALWFGDGCHAIRGLELWGRLP